MCNGPGYGQASPQGGGGFNFGPYNFGAYPGVYGSRYGGGFSQPTFGYGQTPQTPPTPGGYSGPQPGVNIGTPPSITWPTDGGLTRPPQFGNPADQVVRTGTGPSVTPPPTGVAGGDTRTGSGTYDIGTPPVDPNSPITNLGLPHTAAGAPTPPPTSAPPPPVTGRPGLDANPKDGRLVSDNFSGTPYAPPTTSSPDGMGGLFNAIATGNSSGYAPSQINQYGPGSSGWGQYLDWYKQNQAQLNRQGPLYQPGGMFYGR